MRSLKVQRRHGSSAIWPTLQLMRPPNLVTAVADILAGYAAAGLPDPLALFWLLVATIGLYGGGVVLNDVFDAKLDAIERPERPIPKGQITLWRAALLGSVLLSVGIGAGFLANRFSGLIAMLIALLALLYDAWGKHQSILGPINMGACRGLNLLLGISAAPALLRDRWTLALIPFFYIAAITSLSRGEVRGGRQSTGLLALGLIGTMTLALLLLMRTASFEILPLSPFLALFMLRVLPPFWRAYHEPKAGPVRNAVKVGVLSLIILDAAIAAGYAGLLYGLIVLSLLFFSMRTARLFAVT